MDYKTYKEMRLIELLEDARECLNYYAISKVPTITHSYTGYLFTPKIGHCEIIYDASPAQNMVDKIDKILKEIGE